MEEGGGGGVFVVSLGVDTVLNMGCMCTPMYTRRLTRTHTYIHMYMCIPILVCMYMLMYMYA